MSLVYLNGEYVPADEARIPVSDRGLAYGDGVFTTLRVSGGEPLLLGWHLERLRSDSAALYIEPPSVGELEDVCRGLTSRLGVGEAVLRITVTRGAGRRGPSPKNTGGPTVVVAASGPPAPRPPLRAITVPDDRGSLASYKTLNYLPSVLALRRAEDAGCEEAIFIRNGLLRESTVSNLMGLAHGAFRTPPLGGILPGVARHALLGAGAVREDALYEDLPGPLYCINSVRGVEEVAELDGRPLVRDTESRDALQEILHRVSYGDGSATGG